MGRTQKILSTGENSSGNTFVVCLKTNHTATYSGAIWFQMFSIAATIRDTQSDVYIEYLELSV